MFDQIIGWVKKLTEAGIAFLALGIILLVIFGKAVPFIGGDIIGNISVLIGTLGAQGVVGLASVGVIYAIFNRAQYLNLKGGIENGTLDGSWDVVFNGLGSRGCSISLK